MVDLDFRFGGEMRCHRLPITLTGEQEACDLLREKNTLASSTWKSLSLESLTRWHRTT